MKYPQITKQFVRNEIYKLCDGDETREILGEYSYKSTWKPKDIIKTLIRACLERTSIKDICSTREGPSADTIHRRCTEHDWQRIEQLVNRWLREVNSRLYFPNQTKITVVFDIYHQSYYGDPKYEWVTGNKRQNGTNYAVSFLIVALATGTIHCSLVIRLITKERRNNKAALVSEVLGELSLWLDVKRVLFDRGFCQDEIIKLLLDRRLEFVMAAHRFKTIKTVVTEIRTCDQMLAEQAGIDTTNQLALGRWCRKQGLDTFCVEYAATKQGKTPVSLVAAFVRQKTHHRDPEKRVTYCLFLYLTNTIFQLDPLSSYTVKDGWLRPIFGVLKISQLLQTVFAPNSDYSSMGWPWCLTPSGSFSLH